MVFDDLFENRVLVASNLKNCICDRGYTKVSFAEQTEISRPTLDKLLNATINSKATFDRHLTKILKTLNMTATDILEYTPQTKQSVTQMEFQNASEIQKKSASVRQQYQRILTRDSIKEITSIAVSEARKRIGKNLIESRLFGSCARGDYNDESDMDIALFVSDDYSGCNRYTDDVVSIAVDIAMRYFVVVNFVCIPYNDFLQKKSTYAFYNNIEREGVVIDG